MGKDNYLFYSVRCTNRGKAGVEGKTNEIIPSHAPTLNIMKSRAPTSFLTLLHLLHSEPTLMHL